MDSQHTNEKNTSAFETFVNQCRSSLYPYLSEDQKASFDTEFFPEGQLKRSLKGTSNLLIVAPYGFPEDGHNSDYFAFFLSKALDASYIINNKYLKFAGNPYPFGIETDWSNLNDSNSMSFIDKFISAISVLRIKNEVEPVIIMIHTLPADHLTDFYISNETYFNDQKNIVSTQKALSFSEEIQKELNDQSMFSVSKTRLSSYLNPFGSSFIAKYQETGQIPFIEIGIKYNVLSEPISLINAVDTLSQIIKKTTLYVTKNTVTKNSTETKETRPDYALVFRACHKLTEIVSKHYENAMLEAGQYLIKEFYDNNIEFARNKIPSKEKSLYQLIQNLQQMESNAPSKSWIYNAVNLAVDHVDYNHFHTYGKLLLSQKILLFSIDDRNVKESLIDEVVQKKYTVAQLKLRLSEIKRGNSEKFLLQKNKKISKQKNSLTESPQPNIDKTKNISDNNDNTVNAANIDSSNRLLAVVNNPDVLFSDKYLPLINLDSLCSLNMSVLKKLQSLAKQKKNEISSDIDFLTSLITTRKEHLIRYQELVSLLDTPIKAVNGSVD